MPSDTSLEAWARETVKSLALARGHMAEEFDVEHAIERLAEAVLADVSERRKSSKEVSDAE